MSEDVQCALCTDAPATTRLERGGALANRLASENWPDMNATDIVIPLCEGCHAEVTDALSTYRDARDRSERSVAEEQLDDIASELTLSIVEDASG